jgi:hypothetical protein
MSSDLLIAYKIQVVMTYNDAAELRSAIMLVPGYMGPYAFDFYGEITPEVKAQLPTLYDALSDPDAQKGLAITNMIRKLKGHMGEGEFE